jgi:hypothetical protein
LNSPSTYFPSNQTDALPSHNVKTIACGKNGKISAPDRRLLAEEDLMLTKFA